MNQTKTFTLIAVAIVIVIAGGIYLANNKSTSSSTAEDQVQTETRDTTSTGSATISEPVTGVPDTAALVATATPLKPTQTLTEKTYTMAEVQAASTPDKCWTTINGNVYDLTTFEDKHPGGRQRILSLCGKDGSSAFEGQHDGQPKPEAMLVSLKIGVLAK